MRAGSEEVWKDIYIYRTVLANSPKRNRWLSNRLAVILRQVYKSSGNKLDTEPYTGKIPVHYYSDDPNSDPGFADLTPDEYIRYRLESQLDWHEGRLVSIGKSKRNLTIAILAMGASGALLAGIGEPFAVWVALTASITAALTGWEELQNREATIANYSKVKLELTILKDHWFGLTEEERTESEFFKLVLAAENLLWAQNSEYIRSMQEALASFEDEDARLVEDVVRESEAMHQNLQESLYSETAAVLAEANKQLTAVIEDAGDTVEEIVTNVSVEAMTYSDSAERAVDSAVSESEKVRTHIEATVTTEVEAWADSAEEAVDAAAEESAAVRQTAETAVSHEVEAWSASADQVIEGVSAESAAVRDAADAAIAAETEAWGDTAQDTIEAAAAASAAARQLSEAEKDAWQESAQEALDTAAAESAAMREAADTAVDAAAATSASAREAALAEVDEWQATAVEAVEAAAAESDAWRESAETAVDTAVEQSTAARESVDAVVKYAAEFKPVINEATETLEDFQEEFEEVVYQAKSDVKYAINFKVADTESAEDNGDNPGNSDAQSVDAAVNKAVDRILEEGVNVADDAIQDALAKANKVEKP